MLKENSRCAACEKRLRCVQPLMNVILRDKSKAADAVFDMYESLDGQMEILPFLLEKFDEQLALGDSETRDELLRVSAFATRLNALDTLIREASEGEGLSAAKRKIAVTLLLGMIDAHRELGPAILSRFYFHSSAFTLFVRGYEADFAKVIDLLKEKGKAEPDYARVHDDVETHREFIEAMRDHLRRTYGGLRWGEKPVEEAHADVFEKGKGKYLN